MRVFLGLLLLLLLLLSGCLQQERTPYNEVAFLVDSPSEKMVNAWPFYNGNGKVNYVAWPLVKWSAGCAAFLPFYNYDHGIHDFCLLASAVPADGEYRLFPIFYRSPTSLYLFPGGYYNHGCYLAPLFLYEKKSEGNSKFLSPFYSQTEYTGKWVNMDNKEVLTHRQRFFGPLGLLGHVRQERSLDSTVEPLSFDYSFSWVFPLYWRDVDTKSADTILFPIYYSKVPQNSGDTIVVTPLLGWGRGRNADERFWYALTCGGYDEGASEKDARLRWVLPFWFYRDRAYSWNGRYNRYVTSHWTLLSYHERGVAEDGNRDWELHVGPFGWPWLADIERSLKQDQTYIAPVNVTKRYYTTMVDGKEERFALRSIRRKGIGGFLYDWERFLAIDESLVIPEDLAETYTATQGHDFEILWGLLQHKDIYRYKLLKDTQRQFGWFLWNDKKYTYGDDSYTHSIFTPLMSWGERVNEKGEQRSSECGLLMDAIAWEKSPYAFDFDLFWGFLWDGSYKISGSFHHELLFGLPFEQRVSVADEEVTYHKCNEKGCWQSSTCDHPKAETIVRHHGEEIDTDLLCGLLYYRTKYDNRRWVYPYGTQRPEKPTEDYYTDECAVLTPLIYSSDSERDGSFNRRTLLGLFHDHTYDAQYAVETLGILGFLYRYNGYKDGTEERSYFPFIKTSKNEATDTWSFSILHKLFRIDHTTEGNRYWFFWL